MVFYGAALLEFAYLITKLHTTKVLKEYLLFERQDYATCKSTREVCCKCMQHRQMLRKMKPLIPSAL